MAEHTKGPWKVFTSYYGSRVLVVAEDWGQVAHVVSGLGKNADARLIAAAPDLLAALEEVVAISDRKHDAWDRAKAAIAKAKGG